MNTLRYESNQNVLRYVLVAFLLWEEVIENKVYSNASSRKKHKNSFFHFQEREHEIIWLQLINCPDYGAEKRRTLNEKVGSDT